MRLQLIRRFAGIGTVSFINVALTALQSIILGRILNVTDFGVTRTATAYMVTLVMLGHFTLHNALASRIGKANTSGEISRYIASAAFLVATISTITAIVAIFFIHYSGFWNADTSMPLIIIASTLPLVCLTIIFNACLEALGSFKLYAIVIALTSAVPLLTTIPLGFVWSLNGWLSGRVISAVLLAAISVLALREYSTSFEVDLSKCIELLSFARVQIISGLLSLVMMSADVIVLERLTHNLKLVANYGLALLFLNACSIIPTVLGRIYFREIASSYPEISHKRIELLWLTALAALLCCIALYTLAPIIITWYFGERYVTACSLVKIMSAGIFANFLWNSLSVINVAENKPHRAAVISLTGAVTGALALFTLIPKYAENGAAWSMVIAYSCGAAIGLLMVFKNALTTRWGTLSDHAIK